MDVHVNRNTLVNLRKKRPWINEILVLYKHAHTVYAERQRSFTLLLDYVRMTVITHGSCRARHLPEIHSGTAQMTGPMLMNIVSLIT